MQICADFKLQNQLKREKHLTRKELGSLCKQFGYQDTKEVEKCECSRKKITWDYSKRKKTLKKKPPKDFNKINLIKCFKCSKTGYVAMFCRISKKINNTELDEKDKQELEHIMIISESETSKKNSDSNSGCQIDEKATTTYLD